MAETSPARAGAQRSEREKGGDFAPAGSKGRSPWRFFGDFLIGEKVTRVQGGAPASGTQGLSSLYKSPRVQGGAPAQDASQNPAVKREDFGEKMVYNKGEGSG